MDKKFFVHESSYVDENVVIGDGTSIWHFSHIQKNAVIGDHCSIGQNVNIGNDVVIGNNVKIQNNVSVYTGVTVEDDVFLGPSMVFTNVINPRSFINRKNEFKKTLVKKGATIGANATIVCGVTIGEYSFIGAGAVITRDILPYSLVYGNPARVENFICKCGLKVLLKDESWFGENNIEYICDCGLKYKIKNLYFSFEYTTMERIEE
jgi:UDP-2-acetamido-3-amino-2,3-dideoxy-glucuronate N-acetyltransferase